MTYPTIERIAKTPLNETFQYQGHELAAEARRLYGEREMLIKALRDLCDPPTQGSAFHVHAIREGRQLLQHLGAEWPARP